MATEAAVEVGAPERVVRHPLLHTRPLLRTSRFRTGAHPHTLAEVGSPLRCRQDHLQVDPLEEAQEARSTAQHALGVGTLQPQALPQALSPALVFLLAFGPSTSPLATMAQMSTAPLLILLALEG